LFSWISSEVPSFLTLSFFALPRPNLNPTKRLMFNNLVFEEGHGICPLQADKYLFFQ